MTRCILVGDVHARAQDLEDCQRLIVFLDEWSRSAGADVGFLGDLFHNFSLINIHVAEFWRDVFRLHPNWWTVVGNHDQANDGTAEPANAIELIGLSDRQLDPAYPGVGVISFHRHEEPFVARVNELAQQHGCHTIVCHQEFQGGKYDNGFYAPHGFDSNSLNVKHIISGHLHSRHSFGNVTYIGSSRSLTMSEANQTKQVDLVEFTTDGVRWIETRALAGVTRRIIHREETETSLVDPADFLSLDDNRITLRGSEDWMTQRATFWEQREIRTAKASVSREVRVRESMGVDQSRRDFLAQWQSKRGISVKELNDVIDARLSA